MLAQVFQTPRDSTRAVLGGTHTQDMAAAGTGSFAVAVEVESAALEVGTELPVPAKAKAVRPAVVQTWSGSECRPSA